MNTLLHRNQFAFVRPSYFVLTAVFSLGLVTQSASVRATVVQHLNVDALTQEANRVVRAEVIHQFVVPDRGPQGQIYTRTQVRVLENILGHGPQEFSIQQLGGQLNGRRLVISGNARLRVGTEVILFLDRDPATDIHYIVGLSQGLYEIDRSGTEPIVHQDLEGLTFYDVGPQPVIEVVQVETLKSLIARIRPRLELVDPTSPGVLR